MNKKQKAIKKQNEMIIAITGSTFSGNGNDLGKVANAGSALIEALGASGVDSSMEIVASQEGFWITKITLNSKSHDANALEMAEMMHSYDMLRSH